ncbi:MAG: hypothetical protein R3D43_13300 [Tepidamorphaceae bacterium]
MLKATLEALYIFTLAAAPVASLSTEGQNCEAAAQSLIEKIDNGSAKVIDDEGNVIMEMHDGTLKALRTEDGADKPTENAIGSPPGKEAARNALESAIKLAEDGKREECQIMVDDVRKMLSIEKPQEQSNGGMKAGNRAVKS